MDVNIGYNYGRIIILKYVLGKCNPVRVVWDSYQYIPFFVCWTWNRMNGSSGWLLDKDNIKVALGFMYCVNDKVVLSNILWKYSDVLYDHSLLPFTTKQINYFVVSWISWYFFEYHLQLNLCFQKRQRLELAW